VAIVGEPISPLVPPEVVGHVDVDSW